MMKCATRITRVRKGYKQQANNKQAAKHTTIVAYKEAQDKVKEGGLVQGLESNK
jgi:hypothetical protein